MAERSPGPGSGSDDEYQERVRRAAAAIRSRGLDLVIVDQVEHLGYLIGYMPTAATYQSAILTSEGAVVAVVRELDRPTFVEQSWVTDFVTFADWENPIDLLVATIRERGWTRCAIGQELDSFFLAPRTRDAIQEGLPEATFADFSDVLWEQRLRKSAAEIALIERAGAIADAALLAGVAAAGAGRSEREIIAAATSHALRDGADNTRIALMASGPRRAQLHGRLGNRVLEEGDTVHLELVPHYLGYSARIMRTVSVGTPTAGLLDTMARLVDLQDAQFAMMRAGVEARVVDAVARSGLAGHYPNTTGYTLGLVGVPRTTDFTRTFLPTADWLLEAGMVFHMYVTGDGLTLSETVLVEEHGHRRLTQLDRRIFTAGE